jgi:hypothetical protein
MKIITHKFKKNSNDIVYLINLVDVTGHPLESLVADNKEMCLKLADDMATKHNISTILHNHGFSILS